MTRGENESLAELRFSNIYPIHPEAAMRDLAQIDEGPEESHLEADEILLGVLKHLRLDSVAIAWLRCKERNGFWYA